MTVYVLIEHDPYLPEEGFKEHVIAIYKDKEKAQIHAHEYNKIFMPYFYSVRRAEVIE